MLSREEVKSMLGQFESLRFCQECLNNIDGLNEMIRCGERILETVSHTDFPDVRPYLAAQLIVPYWERARYYSRREYYDSSKFQHAKDLDLAISDFSRLLDLLDISGDKKDEDIYLLSAYEGRCECYLEKGNLEAARNDANEYISATKNSKDNKVTTAFTLRAKCNLLIGELDQAEADIDFALGQSPDPSYERANAQRVKERIEQLLRP